MHIAVLTRSDLFPAIHGAAVKIVRTAEALARAGDSVVVVTDDRDAYWRVGTTWERVPYGPRLRALEEAPILRNQARPRRILAMLGYPDDETLLYQAMVDPAWWARVLYVGIRERIDVYHAEFPGFGVPGAIAARLLGGRAVVTEHNVEWDRLRQTTAMSAASLARVRAIERTILRAQHRVIAVSEADRARLELPHVSVVPHGVENAAFERPRIDLRTRYGIGTGPVLFFHGTLHYGPNADALVWIANELLPRLPETVVVLAAGMNPPRHLESARLRFCGPVDDLGGHIAAADLCICPLAAGGGTRMKLLEYFAAGKAVVSTPLGAEGLELDGELVLAELPDFPAAVLATLGDPQLRQRMGHKARAYARARDWATVGETTRRVLGGEGIDFAVRPSIEAHLPPRVPSKPLTLLFLVNRGCNLRCSFCDLWDRADHVPVDKALALLDDAVAIGTRTVVLTGGEPLLHPDLLTIVRGAKARGLGVNITTNGTLLDRHYDALREAGIDSLSFSIDGLPATHDRIRGQARAHARTWAAIQRAVRDGVDTAVYFVVTRENVRELVEVHEQVRRAGARFDFWPVNDAVDQYLTAPADKQAWLDALQVLAGRDAEVARKAHYYAEALGYHAGEAGPVRCLGLVDQYGVTYTGDLLPCCVWGGDGLKVGNVFTTPLRELWTRPDVQAARETLWRAGCTAGCYNHSLYELTQSTGRSHRVE